ncbi:MAG: DUF5110 domain-containing protein [Herpetosiphonaceae bacterium]|nr:DUF5110 domain-containing protein [Herpetosiphonaceae bacterium]
MPDSYRHLAAVHSYSADQHALILDCGGPRLAISALTDRIIRVRLAPDGVFAPRRPWAVAPPDSDFPGTTTELTTTDSALSLRTATLSLQIARATGQLTLYDPANRPFCADASGLEWSSAADRSPVRCAKRIEDGEHFYGFGERTGLLDQRGQRLVNWTTDQYRYGPGTDPLYIAIPTLLAVRPGLAYGVFFNNTWRSAFDMGASAPDIWTMEAAGGELDYYIVYGPTPAEVLQGFGALLGTTPLPPRWALGYHQSRWSYTTESQVRALATEFRRRELPCDAIHFDIDYMDGYRDFTWHPQRFPNPAALLAELRELGIKAVMIVDPGVKIDPDYAVYREGMELGMFIRGSDGSIFHGFVWPDDAVFPDFTRPEVRRWWGEMQRQLVDMGANGIWNDMNEPTVFTLPFSQGGGLPQPIELAAIQGPAEQRTTHAEVHNVYGSGMAQASYEGLLQSTTVRPFVLTRSGYAGIQRWSACWMGDNTSRWEHLEMAMPQLLNMALSGVPFVGTDIGGFFDNADGELFARWMQFGALMPFCRGHSHTETNSHEPWSFGPRVEAICREYLQLRYRLLPYLYTLFWESSLQGGAILRPLFYEFPDDPATYHIHDQVLLGRSLLAAPVYRPGKEHRQVYLPAGEWYDWWTEEVILGPSHRIAEAPLERMPLYVRAGAIIPSAPDQLHTDERPLDLLTLDCYPGSGEFTLYEDDGASFDYQQGQFCTTTYYIRQIDGALHIEGGARTGAYRPLSRRLLLRIHGVETRTNDRSPEADYDADRHILSLAREDDGAAFNLVI